MATKNVSPQSSQPQPYYQPYNNQNDTPPLGPRKTIFVLATVIGCIAILWPKIFYPMMFGSSEVPQIKNTYINKDLKPGGKFIEILFCSFKLNNLLKKLTPNRCPLILVGIWRMLRNGLRSRKICKRYCASWPIRISKAIESDDRRNEYVYECVRLFKCINFNAFAAWMKQKKG